MKRFVVLLAGAAVGAGAVIWWRWRSGASSPAPVQLGLDDGSTLDLEAKEPAVPPIAVAAAEVRRAFASGA